MIIAFEKTTDFNSFSTNQTLNPVIKIEYTLITLQFTNFHYQ